MTHRTRLMPVFFVALSLAAPAWAAEATTQPASTQPVGLQAEKGPRFVRFVDQGASGGRLETEDVIYRNDKGVTVRLVSAVHIGERSYFEGLNKSFGDYDAVLYELVKPKEAEAPLPNTPSDSTVSQFQRFLKDSLNLEFQLDRIDYTRANFVHADLDAETFQRMQAERGESMTTIMLRAMLDALSKPQQAQESSDQMMDDLIGIFTRPDAERQMKLMLARQMNDVEKMTAGLNGPDGSVILTERNKAAMKVLADTMAKGKKNMAIFYGAAHMPDLGKRLEAMGFKAVGAEWRMAWDVTIRNDQPSAVEQLLRNAVRAMGEE